eukprot:m.481088 g.481088  ORF g.481088 m.481088 type:complete len:716 (-) comp22040_c0_seq1:48-2195(-)
MAVLKQGLVSKQGRIIHSWKCRWLVLCGEGDTATEIKYFKDEATAAAGEPPRGIIQLKGARVLSHIAAAAVQSWPHAAPHWPSHVSAARRFVLAAEDRTYFFTTETCEETESWLQVLRPLLDMGEERHQQIVDEDEHLKIVEKASEEGSWALLEQAVGAELVGFADKGSTASDARSEEQPVASSAQAKLLEKTLAEVEELKEVFEATGFELANWGYLCASFGTVFGVSIRLQRNLSKPLDIDDITKKGSTVLQKSVLAMLHRSQNLVQEVESYTKMVSCISISVGGLGLGIPSVTASLSFTDPVPRDEAAGDDPGAERDGGDADAPESKPGVVSRAGASLLSAIGRAAGAITTLVTKPFEMASQSLLQKLVQEIQGLRQGLAAAGLTLKGDWLSVTIGTFVGVSITVTPLEQEVTTKSQVAGLSVFQRMLLSVLVESFEVANKATGLQVKLLSLSLSGIGLAVPFLSATAYLGKPGDKKACTIKEVGELLREQAESEEAKAEEAIAMESDSQRADDARDAEEARDRKTNFILEPVASARKATGRAATFVSAATLHAIYATGDAAEEVLSAVHNVLAAPSHLAGRVFPKVCKDVREELESAESLMEKLPIKVGNPSMTLSFGTVFGASLRFQERERGAVRNAAPADLESVDTEGAGTMGKAVHGLLCNVTKSAALLRELRKEKAHIDLISVALSGIGLGIPAITSSVYIGRDEKKK